MVAEDRIRRAASREITEVLTEWEVSRPAVDSRP
jgi:hypothetical protein